MSGYPKSRNGPAQGTSIRFWGLAGLRGLSCMGVCLLGSCVWGSPGPVGKFEETAAFPAQATLGSATSIDSLSLSEEIPDENENVETYLDENCEDENQDSTEEDSSALIEWQESHGDQCYKSQRYRGFCQGPRRVPVPFGAEAALAQELGLGKLRTMYQLLAEPPDPNWVAAAFAETDDKKLMWPLPQGKYLRGYGMVGEGRNRHLHKGVDIGAEEGTLFFAVRDGIVAYSDNAIRGYGNLLAVIHPDGSVALYSHARALYLFAGQKVKRGQVLGEIGHTGFAQRPHLHFEYRVKGRPTSLRDKFEEHSNGSAIADNSR
jgi:murein DD-endopeptidase MepM/ murein hydrolase activator NlpD